MEDIISVTRAGPPIGKGVNKERKEPRPLIITVKTPELARQLHDYGSGLKIVADGKEYYVNQDLILADRIAGYKARQEKKRIAAERKDKYEAASKSEEIPKSSTEQSNEQSSFY